MPYWDPQLDTATLQAYDILTLTDGDTTPDISGYSNVVTANTGATTITNFDNPDANGQDLKITFGDANTTIQHNANIDLMGPITGTPADDDLGPMAAGDVLQLHYNGSKWVEDFRMLNS